MVKEILVRIDDINDKGHGVGYIGSHKVEVPGVVPGEYVFVKVGRKRLGRVVKFIEKSEHRITPVCPYAHFCGGCLWQDIKYSYQLKLKQKIVDRAFSVVKYDFDMRGVIPSDEIYMYRGKMEFIFAERSGVLSIGLREFGKFDRVVDIFACWLQSSRANNIMGEFRKIFSILDYKPYNIYTHTGFLRYLVIRVSRSTNESLAIIVTTADRKLNMKILASETTADTIVWAVNDGVADVAVGQIKEIYGRGYITESALGYIFRIFPYNFYQSNPLQANKLFDIARKLGGDGERALDLYCGIGTIAIISSTNYDEIIGIELEEDSVRSALQNAEINDVRNVKFLVGRVEDRIKDLKGKFDTIFVDPPRAGLHKKVIRYLAELKPEKIVYVSCNPRTQARDILLLGQYGYRLELLQPIDMLPHTPHVETIGLIVR